MQLAHDVPLRPIGGRVHHVMNTRRNVRSSRVSLVVAQTTGKLFSIIACLCARCALGDTPIPCASRRCAGASTFGGIGGRP